MSVTPAVMFIEIALDEIKKLPNALRDGQFKELDTLGDTRAQSIGASGVTHDFGKGYELGLQTARVLMRGSVELIQKDVNPDYVL